MKGAALLVAAAVAACASVPEDADLPPVVLTPLADGVWLHSSYKVIEPWGPILTNGLVVAADDGVWLIDTAWTDAQTDEVLSLATRETGRAFTHAIFTHAHDDKMGGVGALRDRGIETYALAASNRAAPDRGLVPAATSLTAAASGVVALPPAAPGRVRAFYPGPGHTDDNIVIGVTGGEGETASVLFGGCLIRPGGATSLGNTADGDVGAWAGSVAAAASRFPDAGIVVPSHGAPGGRDLLDGTIRLATDAR